MLDSSSRRVYNMNIDIIMYIQPTHSIHYVMQIFHTSYIDKQEGVFLSLLSNALTQHKRRIIVQIALLFSRFGRTKKKRMNTSSSLFQSVEIEDSFDINQF